MATGADSRIEGLDSGPAAETVAGLSIERIATGGEGVGRDATGRVVFVQRTAPGDRVDVTIVQARARWARGRATAWHARGASRRQAPCTVYDLCGGCRLQHMDGEGQRSAKRELVRESVRRIGGLSVPVGSTIAASEEFGYRNRVTYVVRKAGHSIVAGLRPLTAPDGILDVEHCLLAEPAVRQAWSSVRSALAAGTIRLPPGGESRITVRGSATGEVDLFIESAEAGRVSLTEALMPDLPGVIGCHAGTARAPRCIAGVGTLRDRWQGIDFDLPPAVFLQVNRSASAVMDDWLDRRVGDVSGMRILDLYAGVGARAVRWALRGATVVACERSKRACRAGRSAAAGAGARVEFVAAPVERALDGLLPADLVVVNPPRAGLALSVSRRLSENPSGRLAYVSCDPATLARDLGRLSASWKVVELQPFDAFPQTSHVETIAWLALR